MVPGPRKKKLGIIPFTRNNYGQPDLFGPNGGLSLEDLEEIELNITGTLTISAGTADGVPTYFNPQQLIRAVEIKLTGSPLSDNFLEIPLQDLIVFNLIQEKGVGRGEPETIPIPSGAVGVYAFSATVRVPFCADDMPNPYKYFFPMNRYSQVTLRIKWGTEEDLVAGGDRTKAITACQAEIWGTTYSGDPDFDLRTDMFFAQRVAVRQLALNNTAQVKADLELTRTAAYLRGALLYQFTTDANGVETPTDTFILPTDPVTLRVNDADDKWDGYTWAKFREDNRRHYGKYLPFGYIFLDNSWRGDEELLKKMFMMNFSKMTIRYNNQSIASGNLRISLLKYAAAA